MNDILRLKRTEIPVDKRIDMILDTDTYNEIDDQFAIFYALCSKNRIHLKGIHAALFYNSRSESTEDGMEKSYQEICKILHMAGEDEKLAYRGCMEPLKNMGQYEDSEAVDHLIECAKDRKGDSPLYVVGIGAATNIASAIIKEPSIIEKITVIWLGGNTYDWPEKEEFNLGQDPVAARVLFECGVPLIQVPAFGVTGFLLTCIPELQECLEGVNQIGDYLVQNVKEYETDHFAWSKPIWDIGAIALLIHPDWAPSNIVTAPMITEDGGYSFRGGRKLIRCVYKIDRDRIFRDMFQKIRAMK